jgi:hypothetical protein
MQRGFLVAGKYERLVQAPVKQGEWIHAAGFPDPAGVADILPGGGEHFLEGLRVDGRIVVNFGGYGMCPGNVWVNRETRCGHGIKNGEIRLFRISPLKKIN